MKTILKNLFKRRKLTVDIKLTVPKERSPKLRNEITITFADLLHTLESTPPLTILNMSDEVNWDIKLGDYVVIPEEPRPQLRLVIGCKLEWNMPRGCYSRMLLMARGDNTVEEYYDYNCIRVDDYLRSNGHWQGAPDPTALSTKVNTYCEEYCVFGPTNCREICPLFTLRKTETSETNT